MKRLSAFAISVIIALTNFAAAQGDSISFDEFLASALTTSPEVAKIDALLAERLAEAITTSIKANPELTASFDIPRTRRDDEKSETSVTVSQAIRASDFGTRSALAFVIEKTADIEKQIAINQYIQRLEITYSQAWQHQEIESVLRDTQAQATRFLSKISEGAQRGIFSEGDVALFQAEQKMFEADKLAAQAALYQAKAELTELAGYSLHERRLRKLNVSLNLPRAEIERAVKESRLPAQQRAQVLKNLAQKQLEVAKLDSFPSISPMIGYSRHDDGIDQITMGFSMPLSFFDRNQAERTKARSALAAAEQTQRYSTSDDIIKAVQFSYESFERLNKQVELYEQGVLPAKKKVVDAYYRQFDAGLGTPFQLWQALRELHESQLRAIELRTTLTSAYAQIKALLGKQS